MSVRFLILFLCLHSALTAAAPRVLVWDDSVASRELALARGREQVELSNLHPSKRSEPIRLKGTGPIFLRALDRNSEDEGPVQRECAISESLAHPLLLLMPDEKDATGIRVVVFEDDPSGFQWGSYRFLNATPKTLALRLEDRAEKIPGGWKPVDIRLTGETRGIGVMIAPLENLKRPHYSAVWEHEPETRTLCFIVPGTDPRLGPIAIKAVPQSRKSFELELKPEGAEASAGE
ncbi:hypothetical protein HAHE_27580 [Haloferula helveola]|uniref:Uncharacterized protein n=1 Tax=Haloferula helveola TaxID=490095 RepID=A0ABN6H5A5_9BACT|nr:hypothetical protein HAHE_27580 [Haloferula helveola]